MRRLRFTRPALVLALAALPACDGGDTTEPTTEEVAGTYAATTLVGKEGATEIDVLAEGATLEVTLAANGTTSGTFFVPEGEEDGSDLTADLTGTWSLSGDEVTFEHDADTFMRDVVFEYDDGRLSSDNVYARVVLTRVDDS